MRVLRFEMTRAFRNKWLAVSVALGTLIGLADIWLNVSQYGFNRGRALIQTWIGTDYQFAYNSLFYVLLPLIACFPYAGSCYQDQKTGYESSICIKTSRLSYMIAKEAAVAASGAAAVDARSSSDEPKRAQRGIRSTSRNSMARNMFTNLPLSVRKNPYHTYR